MEKVPIISILLATYNGEKYLSQQIESILTQTYKDFILYISDDGSSDKTPDIIKEYSKKDSRIKSFPKHESTKSACKHFLYMLEKINSDLYLFCDQDDVWTNNHVQTFVQKYNSLQNKEKEKPVLIHSDLKIVDEKMSIIADSFIKYNNLPETPSAHFYFSMNNVTGCAMCINNALKECAFKKYDILEENTQKIMMHDIFFATIACLFGTKIFISNSTVFYRQHGANVCGAGEAWSIKKILKSFYLFKQHKLSYNQHKVYAAFFVEYFKEELSEKERKCLLDFSNLSSINKISRIIFLCSNGFLKLNIVRKLWLCLVV